MEETSFLDIPCFFQKFELRNSSHITLVILAQSQFAPVRCRVCLRYPRITQSISKLISLRLDIHNYNIDHGRIEMGHTQPNRQSD